MRFNSIRKAVIIIPILTSFVFIFLSNGCQQNIVEDVLKPIVVTEKVKYDTDDPAIWINHEDPSKSLILGTDKDDDGAIYVFDLNGKIIEEKTVRNIVRPNNIDVRYGMTLNGKEVDIAAATERGRNCIRVFSLPDMQIIDNGGIKVFEDDDLKAPMGISLYKRQGDGAMFAIVSRKEGPSGS